MSARSRLLYLVCAGILAAPVPALAWITLGHGRVVGSADARLDYDSNIFLNNSQVDDWIGSLSSDVRYIRDSGVVTFDADAGATGRAFADHSNQNGIDPFVTGRFGYQPSDKTTLNGGLGYRRNSLGNAAVNDRTKSNDLTLNGLFEHLATEKFGWRVEGDYANSNYLTTGYSNVESYNVGAHAVHAYSPKLKFLAGVTTGQAWTSGAAGRRSASAQDWRYTVGAEGEFAPKVTGLVSAGLVQRGFKGTGFFDNGTLYLSSRIAWAKSEKTTIAFLAGQNLSLTAADQSAKSFDTSLTLNHNFSEKLTFDGAVGYNHSNFTGFLGAGSRKDEGYSLRARVNYVLRDNTSFSVSSGYRDTDSTLAVSTYDRFTFGAGITVRF
jgi:hypothetical protein